MAAGDLGSRAGALRSLRASSRSRRTALGFLDARRATTRAVYLHASMEELIELLAYLADALGGPVGAPKSWRTTAVIVLDTVIIIVVYVAALSVLVSVGPAPKGDSTAALAWFLAPFAVAVPAVVAFEWWRRHDR